MAIYISNILHKTNTVVCIVINDQLLFEHIFNCDLHTYIQMDMLLNECKRLLVNS